MIDRSAISEVIEAIAHNATSQRNDGIGTSYSPMHSDEFNRPSIRLLLRETLRNKNSPGRADPTRNRPSPFARCHHQLNLPISTDCNSPTFQCKSIVLFATETGSECCEFESLRVVPIRFEYIPSRPRPPNRSNLILKSPSHYTLEKTGELRQTVLGNLTER